MITPEQLAAKGDEHSHQVALFQWIALVGSKRWPEMRRAFAIPNGSKLAGIGTAKGKSEGAKMLAEGVRPGVPDILWPWGRASWGGQFVTNGKTGLWVELKKPGREATGRKKDDGRSEQQVDWHRWLAGQGWAVVTAYGWVDAAWAMAHYAAGRLDMPRGAPGEPDDCLFAFGTTVAPTLDDLQNL